jgi:hypothetical protein
VEAVILLPTLVILLIGARFMVRRYEGELRALGEARTCAVQFGYTGCRKVPAECTPPLVSLSEGADKDGTRATVSRKLVRAEGTVKRLSSVPVLGAALDGLVGQKARSERVVAFEGLDRSTKTAGVARGSGLFPCNEMPRADDVAKEVFESVASPFLSPP